MMDQTLFNIVLCIASTLSGFVLHAVWRDVKELQTRMNEMAVLVAGQYVKRDELTAQMGGIAEKLDRLEQKIDRMRNNSQGG